MRPLALALTVQLLLPAAPSAAENWPAFRGAAAQGVGSGAPPVTWDVDKSINVAWNTPVAGFAISSPIVWGDRIYVTTAIAAEPPRGNDFRTRHVWKLLSIDRTSGRIVWEQIAHDGVPYMQRHVHSSYANATPATNGQYIVALFATEALACYDMSGTRLWKKPLRVTSRPGAFDFGSSPVIVDDLVIVQDDRDRDSSVAAYRLKDGSEVWRVDRIDGPSQSTPAVWTAGINAGPLLILVAPRAIRAVDARTGRAVWSFATQLDRVAASPTAARDLVISAAGDVLQALRPGGARQNIPASGQTGNDSLIWRDDGDGAIIPTPLILGDAVFVLGDSGVLTAYDVRDGRRIKQQRTSAGSFCASPIAADGRIYVFSREGDATVLRAGPTLDVIARNRMGELTMATPAIADGTLYVRTAGHLIALRDAHAGTPR